MSNLTQADLISRMDPANRAGIFSAARQVHYASGTVIFDTGAIADSVLMIDSGRVEISRLTPGGRRQVLDFRGTGEIVGEIAAMDMQTRTADVIACSDVVGRQLSSSDFRASLLAEPDVLMEIAFELCAKLRSTMDLVETQAERQASLRLAQCLYAIMLKWGRLDPGGQMVLDQGFSQSDLGDFAGLARENVNRCLKRWSAEGILSVDDGVITLHTPQKLRELF